LRLFYQSTERPLLDVPRATGSVAKVIAALSLARSGSANDYYCNLRIDGVLRNADGDTGRSSCSGPGALISARDSFRKSMNLPIFYALNAAPEKELRQLSGRAGFEPYPQTAPRTALAFGLVSASPGDMVRLMTAISNGQRGGQARASAPRIIATLSWRDGRTQSRLPARALDLSSYLAQDHASQFTETVLAAPLSQGGTASGLSACGERMGWQLAKTGTVALDGHVASKLLVAAGRYHNQPVTMIGVVGTVADSGNIGPITTGAIANVLCKSTGTEDVLASAY
jgi:membrane peptidoglycan carboxypeptidase